jgi:hypothetical protein
MTGSPISSRNRFVHLDVSSFQLERHLLAELVGGVSHHALEPLERLAHRHHPALRDLILQVANEPGYA